jgi:hypothetical protein
MLLAAVLAAEEVHFVLVGSAGLHLHGERIRVRDIDAVPAPGRENLGRLHSVLGGLSVDGRVPAVRWLATAHVVSIRTSFGRLDCLLERGRRDWDRLRAGARPFDVSGARVLAAGADDIRLLRARFKDADDD